MPASKRIQVPNLAAIVPGGPMPCKVVRPRAAHLAWQGRRDIEPGPKPKMRDRHIKEAVAQKRANKVIRALSRIRWNGDPSIQPPALIKPVASGPLGKCPDDEEIPWHRRTKANR